MAVDTTSRSPDLFPGVANFRDCGGYASRFGGHVQRGRLYRAGQLSDATHQATVDLHAMDFRLIADLRYPVERRHEPSPWPDHWSGRVISHAGERDGDGDEAPHIALLRTAGADPALITRFYQDFYQTIPYNVNYAPLFGQVLNALSRCDGRALIHCSAGKDRTGLMVALLHHILGVSREDILDDYMRTAHSSLPDLVPSIAAHVERRYGIRHSREVILALLGVDPDYLNIGFRRMEQTAGSIDLYLDFIGVPAATRVALRARLIVPE